MPKILLLDKIIENFSGENRDTSVFEITCELMPLTRKDCDWDKMEQTVEVNPLYEILHFTPLLYYRKQ